MTNKIIPVGIFADHAVLKGLLARYLQSQVDVRFAEFVAAPDDLSPFPACVDVVLIGSMCSESFGLEMLNKMKDHLPDARCLLLSTSEDEHYISRALEYGIYGYLSPLEPVETLMRAIRSSAEGKILPTPLLTKAMYFNRKCATKSLATIKTNQLTERDKKVLQLIWEEKNNKEIAAELFIGIRAVEKIRQNLKRKLGAKSTIGMLKHIVA